MIHHEVAKHLVAPTLLLLSAHRWRLRLLRTLAVDADRTPPRAVLDGARDGTIVRSPALAGLRLAIIRAVGHRGEVVENRAVLRPVRPAPHLAVVVERDHLLRLPRDVLDLASRRHVDREHARLDVLVRAERLRAALLERHDEPLRREHFVSAALLVRVERRVRVHLRGGAEAARVARTRHLAARLAGGRLQQMTRGNKAHKHTLL